MLFFEVLGSIQLAKNTFSSNHIFLRQRSDLSDASTCASAASRTPIKKISSITAPERMRAAVKEKDAKIEQLMKERNLERQEIAKAASQTEQVEENLEQVSFSVHNINQKKMSSFEEKDN